MRIPRWIAGVTAMLLVLGCARDRDADRTGILPVGGTPVLEAALQRALHGAEPGGAVLVVLWTIQSPPPLALQDLSKRWAPHGLVALGVCVEAVPESPRDRALDRVRTWQRRGRPGIPSIVFDGDAASLARTIPDALPSPGIVLLDAQGKRIWSGEGFGETDTLEGMLQAHLGEPNVAGGDDGCTCARALSAGSRAGWVGGLRLRSS
jgi:hypothetical protein